MNPLIRYYPHYKTYIYLKRLPIDTEEQYKKFIKEWKYTINLWSRSINSSKRIFKRYQRNIEINSYDKSPVYYGGYYQRCKDEYKAYVTLLHYLRKEKQKEWLLKTRRIS